MWGIIFAKFCRYEFHKFYIKKIQYTYIYIRYKWIRLQNCVLYGNMLVILNKNCLFVSNSKIWISLGFLLQDVIEKCNLSGDYFNAYLHQNYLEFFSEISDVVRASEYLSDSDFMTFEWSVSDTIVLLSKWIRYWYKNIKSTSYG